MPLCFYRRRGEVPHLEEPTDLFTRLQPLLPSLLLEPEVEFIRGAKVETAMNGLEVLRPAIATSWCPVLRCSQWQ